VTTFGAKIKIDSILYSVTWDVDDKITIPSELTAVLSSEEMIQLIIALRSIKLWMDVSVKKKIVMDRDD
jgi:hypothetical protein